MLDDRPAAARNAQPGSERAVRVKLLKSFGALFVAARDYWAARLRMIGRCPPHRYEKGGQEFPFCLDCGEYRHRP